jgi:hypothetical protein
MVGGDLPDSVVRYGRYSRESEKILSLSGPTALTIVVIQGIPQHLFLTLSL